MGIKSIDSADAHQEVIENEISRFVNRHFLLLNQSKVKPLLNT